MSKLYSAMLKVLQLGRRDVSLPFFESIGYLFVDWSKIPRCDIDQDDVTVYWVSPYHSFHNNAVDVSIPDMLTIASKEANVDELNENTYDSFVRSRPEQELLVMHDVKVRRNGRKNDARNHTGEDRVPLRKTVHLMDVAAKILRTMMGFNYRDYEFHDILRFGERSLETIYAVSLILREALYFQEDVLIQDPPSTAIMNSTNSGECPSPKISTQVRRGHNAYTEDGQNGTEEVVTPVKDPAARATKMALMDKSSVPAQGFHDDEIGAAVHESEGNTVSVPPEQFRSETPVNLRDPELGEDNAHAKKVITSSGQDTSPAGDSAHVVRRLHEHNIDHPSNDTQSEDNQQRMMIQKKKLYVQKKKDFKSLLHILTPTPSMLPRLCYRVLCAMPAELYKEVNLKQRGSIHDILRGNGRVRGNDSESGSDENFGENSDEDDVVKF